VTRLLVEQTTAVSTDWLGASAGRLSGGELQDLDEALVTVFGL
jgi:mRNA-degrading endonuclease toxin of MazEF toxin-antitoxin module